MAKEKFDRSREIEALAAQLYMAKRASVRGMTDESLAVESLAAARMFYRVVDDQNQPVGVSAPTKSAPLIADPVADLIKP